jgi:hypothetical protein
MTRPRRKESPHGLIRDKPKPLRAQMQRENRVKRGEKEVAFFFFASKNKSACGVWVCVENKKKVWLSFCSLFFWLARVSLAFDVQSVSERMNFLKVCSTKVTLSLFEEYQTYNVET